MDIEQLKIELEEYGFVIIHNLIPTDEADRMAKRVMEILNQLPSANQLNQGQQGLLNIDDQDTFVPLVTNPVYLELAEHMLGPDFQLGGTVGGIWIKPGAKEPNLHADVPIGWFPQSGLPVPDACFIVNSLWMLTDFTLENGATRLMPFSHHSRRVPRGGVDYKHLVAAEGPAGSIVIFHGSVWHRGGANVTADKQRVGLGVTYYASWMDPAAGDWHLMKCSVRDRMPPLVQQMNTHVVEDE